MKTKSSIIIDPVINTVPQSQRLYSLDALRGFDMLWITGGQKIIFALATATGLPFFQWLNGQMHHVKWNGFAFYDMIFPLFLFLAGVSLPYSFAARKARGETKTKIYRHAFVRMIILVILGMIINHLLDFDFENMRYVSVLGRIGIAWFFAALILLNASVKWQVVWFWGLLIAYYLLMVYVEVPGYGAGVLTLEGNLAGYIDRMILPGKFYLGVMDPEGVLSNIPAVSTALLGVFAGHFLRSGSLKMNGLKKALTIVGAGVLSLMLGLLWGTFFPINKSLWTSSFVLFAGGWSLILLGVFYLIIDVWRFKKWAFFFVVIGMNSITIYMLQNRIIRFDVMRDFFFSGLMNLSPEGLKLIIGALGYVACVWVFLYLLYRNRVFLKV